MEAEPKQERKRNCYTKNKEATLPKGESPSDGVVAVNDSVYAAQKLVNTRDFLQMFFALLCHSQYAESQKVAPVKQKDHNVKDSWPDWFQVMYKGASIFNKVTVHYD